LIFNRIKEIREKLGFSRQDDFAKTLDISFRTYQTYEQGQVKVIPHTFIEKLHKQYNVSLEWLLLGKGDIFIDDKSNAIVNVNNSNNVAVNGTICINTKDYVDSAEIKELLELLKDVPKSWVKNMIDKLKKSLNAIDNDFKE
jgi:transcriptional regulator with XRE-family HTH domain